MSVRRTPLISKHPIIRAKKKNKKFSWYKAAKALGISIRVLRANYDKFDADQEAAFEVYLSGD